MLEFGIIVAVIATIAFIFARNISTLTTHK